MPAEDIAASANDDDGDADGNANALLPPRPVAWAH